MCTLSLMTLEERVTKAFCSQVKCKRVALNINQVVLSRRIGVSQGFISKLEQGESGPLTIGVMIKLGRALKIPVSELISKYEK